MYRFTPIIADDHYVIVSYDGGNKTTNGAYMQLHMMTSRDGVTLVRRPLNGLK